MKPTFVDLETYYNSKTKYSLRYMTPVEYILDPQFEAIGLAYKHGFDGVTTWVAGPDIPKFLETLDAGNTFLVSHNFLFDGCILAWRYGFIPKLMTCTLNISRACLGHMLKSLSLKKVALHLGIGLKGDMISSADGMNLAMIQAAGLYEAYQNYCKNDTDLCAGIFKELVLGQHLDGTQNHRAPYPINELFALDMVLRCAVKPKFVLDKELLYQHLSDVQIEKDNLISQAMLAGAYGISSLSSAENFAGLLRTLGVEPPTKISLTTGRRTYAFAKTDVEFLALEEHPDSRVQAVVAARLGVKSTLEESRTERLIKISELEWPGMGQRALMPVPLKCPGAHTGRLSGDWKLNMQNLPVRGKSNAIRRSLRAPDGYSVLTVDASQIEARLTAWICGQNDLVEGFRLGREVYAEFAAEVFGFPVTKEGNPGERFVGKTGILSLGFQSGGDKFDTMVSIQSKAQTGVQIDLGPVEAARIVQAYRRKYIRMPQAWNLLLETGIPVLSTGGSFQFGPCVFEKGRVRLPTGLFLHYHNLQYRNDEWWFEYAGIPTKLYGGKLLENIVQALDRSIVIPAAVRCQARMAEYNTELALQGHDENVYVVPNEHFDAIKHIAVEEMTRVPAWATGLPLAVEASKAAPTYGDAK